MPSYGTGTIHIYIALGLYIYIYIFIYICPVPEPYDGIIKKNMTTKTTKVGNFQINIENKTLCKFYN